MNTKKSLKEALAQIELELQNLSFDLEIKAKEMLRLWSEKIPFGTRPEYIFFENYEKLPEPEILRRLYLVCEWYKLWNNQLNTPRAKILEQLLKKFSRTEDLIE